MKTAECALSMRITGDSSMYGVTGSGGSRLGNVYVYDTTSHGPPMGAAHCAIHVHVHEQKRNLKWE